MKTRERDELRRAVADYMQSEGCSCCQDDVAHAQAEEELARLLDVPRYSDDSGFNFDQFATRPQGEAWAKRDG